MPPPPPKIGSPSLSSLSFIMTFTYSHETLKVSSLLQTLMYVTQMRKLGQNTNMKCWKVRVTTTSWHVYIQGKRGVQMIGAYLF